jgi:GTP-binding protein
MAGTDARDPLDDYKHLLTELENYQPELLKKPILVAANKMDEEVSAENLKRFKKKFKKVKIWQISCLTGDGLDELKEELRELVQGTKK